MTTGVPDKYTYRAHITKDEPVRYLSHLDYADLMQRALRRAKLPLAYSAGFNPHVRLSFATALAVGTTTDAEFMDVELTEALPPAELRERLREQLPDGVRVLGVKVLWGRHRALMATVAGAVYEVTLPAGDAAAARGAVDDFNARPSAMYTRTTPKSTRTFDLKPYLLRPVEVREDSVGVASLHLEVRVTPTGSVKPVEFLRAMCLPDAPILVHRTSLLFS